MDQKGARFTGDKTPPEQVAVIPKGTSISPAWVFLENSDIKMYCRYIPATETKPQMIRVDSIVGSALQRLLDEWREDYFGRLSKGEKRFVVIKCI